MTADESRELVPGSRLRTGDGHYGTVRYVGGVAGTQGQWYGVEWDTDGRGKHDGQHEGVRYFTAKPGRGSFIRPKKVQKSTTFVKALTDRYGLQGPNAGVEAEELFVGDGQGRVTVVEMVGAEKVNKLQSEFQFLDIVVLTEMMIHGLEPGVDLAKLIPRVSELNISRNLIGDWGEVAVITRQLGRLRTLNASENRFVDVEVDEKLCEAFSGLKTLYLNKMELSFDTVLKWSKMWSGLQQLHICFNGIQALSDPGNQLVNLQLLNMEGNPLNSWDELMHLQRLPNLETLILNDTGLKTIDLKKKEENGFLKLINVSLCRNQISDWSSINELARLKIQDLKVPGNPLLKTDKWDTIRDTIIAKIGTLKVLNRTVVPTEDRPGAEFWYLKQFGPDWLAAGGNPDPGKDKTSPEFLENHPRYLELVKKYGAPEASEMYRAPKGLKDNLIQIHIKGPTKTITKNVPFTMSVQKLKTLVQKLMKANISTLTLTDVGQGESIGKSGNRVELDNDLRDLSFYSVASGDILEATWT